MVRVNCRKFGFTTSDKDDWDWNETSNKLGLE